MLSVKDSYDLWVNINGIFTPKENFQFLTHCTKSHLKKTIQDEHFLKKCLTPNKWAEPLANYNAPHGVWFGVTLRDGKLPDMSPFGTERVLKPVESLQMDLGSCIPVLYLEAIRFNENITNVRLILLTRDDNETIAWCKVHCLELDISDNPFLTITCNMMNNIWIWTTLKNGPLGLKPDTWVALFIARDVDITGCTWDTVEQYKYCTNCDQIGHFNPGCPKTVCYKCGGLGHWAVNCPLNLV